MSKTNNKKEKTFSKHGGFRLSTPVDNAGDKWV
jgi:hypothetical protein